MLLVGLDERLKERVCGQDEAVDAICRAVKRSRVGLNDPDRPIAAMLFCGPTGVGKTELTKALAACYFGSVTIYFPQNFNFQLTYFMSLLEKPRLVGQVAFQ